MKARAKVSVAVVMGGAVLSTMLMAACGSDSANQQPSAGSPGASGTATTAGTGGAASGGSAGAATGGSGGSGMGLAPVNGLCPPNTIKHPDMLCYCQPATLTACSNGCGDLQTDPDRCGSCDTKCMATQACSAGKCGAAPTALVPAAAGCGDIYLAAAGSNLYWTDKMHGTISSVPKAGGAAMPLVTGEMSPTLITATATSLYWLATTAKTVKTAAVAGGAATAVFAAGADDVNGFTLSADGKSLIYATKTKIMQTTAAPGGTPAELGHEDSGIPKALAAVGDFIAYPADINGDVDVMKIVAGTPSICASEDAVGVVNTNCNRLARSQGELDFDNIFIVGDNVYWVNGTQISTSSASMPTGFNETVAQTQNPAATAISAFTVNDGVVYFADDAGAIYKAPLKVDAQVTTLARGQMTPSSILSDGTNVYWATADCAIMSVAAK